MKTPNLSTLVDRVKEQVEIVAMKGDIDRLITECESLTKTNCGWQEYHMSLIIKEYANYLKAIQEARNA